MNKIKPLFESTFNLGHVITVIAFITSAAIVWGSTTADIKTLRRDLDNHTVLINKLDETQNAALRNLERVTTILEDMRKDKSK